RAVWCSLGAATASEKPGGVVERQRSGMPVVTTRAKRKIFGAEAPYLDFRGHRAVRPALSSIGLPTRFSRIIGYRERIATVFHLQPIAFCRKHLSLARC